MIRVVDIESSGLPEKDKPLPGVCEIAFTDVAIIEGEPRVGPTTAFLCNPGQPIGLEAMSVHHITNEMVDGLPSVEEIIAAHGIFTATGIEAFAAHSAQFEKQFLKTPPEIPWLCTHKVAVTLAPNLMRHNNQYLRYALKLDVNAERASPPHRAGPDSHITSHLLARMWRKLTVEQMVEISSKPLILPRLTFGKNAGIPCADIPLDYWEWVVKNIIDNDDVQATARHYLSAPARQRIVPGGHGDELPIDGSGT